MSCLAGASLAEEQVIVNPYVQKTTAKKTTKSAPTKSTTKNSTTSPAKPGPTKTGTAKKNGATPAPPVAQTSSLDRLQAKYTFEDALNDVYRTESNITQRGRIWAETKEEWTDIRIVESNLEKAASLFASGEQHWDEGRYEAWHRAWSQAADTLERSRPQLIRIEHMIRVRRNQ